MKKRTRFVLFTACLVGLLITAPAPPDPTPQLRSSPPPGRTFSTSGSAVFPSDERACPSSIETAGDPRTSYFDGSYRLNFEETWADAIFPATFGFLVLGDHNLRGGDGIVSLTRLDVAGHPVDSYDVVLSASWPKGMKQTRDGGFLLSILEDEPQGRDQEGRLLKLDPDLTIQWSKGVSSTSATHIGGVTGTVDGGVVGVARAPNHFGVFKLNADGSLAWQKGIGSEPARTPYDVYENTYLDAGGNPHCGGYVIYGAVVRAGTDWDLFLAGLSCDGNSLLWQRILSGAGWEGSYYVDAYGTYTDRTHTLAVVADHNGLNSQNADLLVAATTRSFRTNQSILLVPFTVSGGTSLTNPPVFGAIKILDSSENDWVIGPYGNTGLIPLDDGNLLLTAYTDDTGTDQDALLVKLDPDLNVIWQRRYSGDGDQFLQSAQEMTDTLLVAGWGPQALLLELEDDGSGQGRCLQTATGALTVSVVTPDIITPTYTLDSGSLNIQDITVTLTNSLSTLYCPNLVSLPAVIKDE